MFKIFTTLLIATLPPFAHAAVQDSFTDETLVAWVAPANLTQRGGSVLTLENRRGSFDGIGIVFGELAAGKWMAGSDFFSRTERDQAFFQEETAESGTLVQIAVVYQGMQVTAYRNGARYSQHAIGVPQPFGTLSMVSASATPDKMMPRISPGRLTTRAFMTWR